MVGLRATEKASMRGAGRAVRFTPSGSEAREEYESASTAAGRLSRCWVACRAGAEARGQGTGVHGAPTASPPLPLLLSCRRWPIFGKFTEGTGGGKRLC